MKMMTIRGISIEMQRHRYQTVGIKLDIIIKPLQVLSK